MRQHLLGGARFILLLILSFFALVPYLWMVLSSFKGNLEIIRSDSILPEEYTVEGYRTVVTDAPFLEWLTNSLITSVAITIATMFTSALAGYIFAKFDFKGKKLLFILVLSTLMVPFQIIMIPSYLIIYQLNLVNSLLAIIVPTLVSAFGIFLAKQFVEDIPRDYMEAARIDGASEFTIFWRVVVPFIRPVLSALGLFTFMTAWNNYLWPLIVLNDMEKMTLPLALVFFNSKHITNYNVVMSASVLIMIPVVVAFLIFQKQFIKGLTLSGFK